MKVLLVDPSLFTAPYDTELDAGLRSIGVETSWAIRPIREGEECGLPIHIRRELFYKHVEHFTLVNGRAKTLLKGIAHLVGCLRLLRTVAVERPDVVHFQWTPIPPVDILVLKIIRLFRPVILTVHDSVPFNGEKISFIQTFSFYKPIQEASAVIVHTLSAKQSLLRAGIANTKINVVPHGPLHLPPVKWESEQKRAGEYIFLLFGEIKPYKGLDILIEALSRVHRNVLKDIRVIVAGRPRMDISNLLSKISELNLETVFDIRPERQSEAQMAALFDIADCFIFPYRQIDASGVYFLVKGYRKWMIASKIGIFEEDIRPQESGQLVTPADVESLAEAITHAAVHHPKVDASSESDSWISIARITGRIYQQAM